MNVPRMMQQQLKLPLTRKASPAGLAARATGWRQAARRRLGVALAMLATLVSLAGLAIAGAGAAAANPIVVVDIDSGRVLYAKQATDAWYPASVTKVMTAYLTLHALRSGRLKLDTPLKVSARAASVPPSKMGFRPGVEVTVDNALKMMMVKSANDMAMVLAEGVGGSIENFAGMMNEAAQELGMYQTHFVNPHGLPDPGNRSSARDLAVLGRTALRQFPEYAHYFNIEAVQLGRRVFKNTNGLVGRYPDITGMKTGFICSSGFNVMATATRGNRRLLVVVLGASSGAARTLMAAALFDRGFADSGWGGPGTLDTLPLPVSAQPPDLRDQICGAGRGARGEEEAETGSANPTPFLALFGGGSSSWEVPVAGRTLPPRAPLQAIPVFVGREPGAEQAAAAAAVAAARRGRPRAGETASAYVAEEARPDAARALDKVRRPTKRQRQQAVIDTADDKPASKKTASQTSAGKKATDKKEASQKSSAQQKNAKPAAKDKSKDKGAARPAAESSRKTTSSGG